MKLIAEGLTYASYSLEPGEERPKEMPMKAPRYAKLRMCSQCKQRGVFEST